MKDTCKTGKKVDLKETESVIGHVVESNIGVKKKWVQNISGREYVMEWLWRAALQRAWQRVFLIAHMMNRFATGEDFRVFKRKEESLF